MANNNYITLGKNNYNISWLKSVSEKVAVSILVRGGHDENQVRNAWKQANGKSVRNYSKPAKDSSDAPRKADKTKDKVKPKVKPGES